jgi:hypothetical protein
VKYHFGRRKSLRTAVQSPVVIEKLSGEFQKAPILLVEGKGDLTV